VKPFRTLLFPTDFSKAVAEMVPYVSEIAQRFSASVTVLHVFDLLRDNVLTSPYETICESGAMAIPYTAAFEEARQKRQRELEEFARDRFPGVRCVASIQDGDPATVIEAVARNENVDLIVLPTRGLGRFRRLLLGSVTAKVLHDIGFPVLTSSHEPDPALTPGSGYRSIVCAVDMNQEAGMVLKTAAFLAQTYGARLCLAHIESATPWERRPAPSVESVRQLFQQAVSAEGKKEVDAKVCMLKDGLPESIRETALQEKADLVVVGRGHERGDLSRIWSHLYTIIRESPCPVLSV
jgi:nucleotide-binding universal stress UspA family protein